MGKEDAEARALVAKAVTAEQIRDLCKRTINDLKAAPQEQKEKVARLLAAIIASGPEFLAAMVRAGCINPLVSLLAGFDGGQIAAATVLAGLAANPSHRPAIVAAGGLVPLAMLLRNGSNKAACMAAAALAALSMDESSTKPLVKAGALLPLVRLLREGTADAQMVNASLFNS